MNPLLEGSEVETVGDADGGSGEVGLEIGDNGGEERDEAEKESESDGTRGEADAVEVEGGEKEWSESM